MDQLSADFLTPVGRVFTRTHFGTMLDVDASAWSLRIEGLVEHPLRFTLEELKDLPATRLTAFHECFGSPLRPNVPVRAVANLQWLGVRLADLLERAVPQQGARHVWLEGLDRGSFHGSEEVTYLKDLPLETARHDLLVAYEMNGKPLESRHGFPVRAVVPRMFGTNSVKWLSRVIVSDARPEHLFTTRFYNRVEPDSGELRPVRQVDVNSVLISPRDKEELQSGQVEISGWAWSATEVVGVDISVDDGPWEAALLAERGEEPTWQRFSLTAALSPGPHRIRCRARDRAGREQPEPGARNSRQEIRVLVRGADGGGSD